LRRERRRWEGYLELIRPGRRWHHREALGHKVHWVRRETRVLQVHKDCKEYKAQLDKPVPLDHKVRKGTLGRLACKDHKV